MWIWIGSDFYFIPPIIGAGFGGISIFIVWRLLRTFGIFLSIDRLFELYEDAEDEEQAIKALTCQSDYEFLTKTESFTSTTALKLVLTFNRELTEPQIEWNMDRFEEELETYVQSIQEAEPSKGRHQKPEGLDESIKGLGQKYGIQVQEVYFQMIVS